MSTILTPCFKGLEVFRDLIAPPAGDHTPSMGIYRRGRRFWGGLGLETRWVNL